MDFVPGVSVGPLQLGNTLQHTMAVLRTLVSNTALATGGQVDLVVAPKISSDVDILLNAKSLGISCRLDCKEQTLRLIEIYNFTKFPLLFRGQELGSSPSLRSILKRLGPTYPGHVSDDGDFILGYPGIAFVFPIPAHLLTSHEKSAENRISSDLLLAIPSEKSPITSRIYVFNPAVSAHEISKEIIKRAPPVLLKSRTQALLHCVPGRGLAFPGSEDGGDGISFGCHSQDVLCSLGSPTDVFGKTADAAVDGGGMENGLTREYVVWNYFNLGLDVVMDSSGARVDRFVLHCNLPTHYSFGRYVKCNFRMLLSHDGDKGHLIDGSSSWPTVQKLLGPPPKHMVYNKAMGSSPFGGSEYFGYEGLIFEVIDGNQIASIVMFRV
ncbi:hypothetical protein BDR26DRAFT_628532 [Obelidium mucronatum]|nr:hypothetical protein BDR26DRAFT_628532 [Obelidium mucronatum]